MRKLLLAALFALLAAGAFAQTTSTGPINAASIIANSGTAVSNTGISTSEVSLVAIPFPAMGPNDTLEITTLWNTAGVATNTKTLAVRYGTAACTPLATCIGASGGTPVMNQVMNTSALISNQVFTAVRNANSTSAQVFHTLGVGLQSFGASNAVAGTGVIQTNAGGFINITCITATATTDTCTILGYTVKLVRG